MNKQTNNESTQLQQIPIILHAIQSPCNPLQETLSEIFFCYGQTHYLMAATEIIQKWWFIHLYNQLTWLKAQKSRTALSSQTVFQCVI